MDPLVDVRVYIKPDDRRDALIRDVRAGLGTTPKSLPPVWFYDRRGSELFEEITRLKEYYPTRAERSILLERAGEIADFTEADTLVELGSGSSEKTRLLLDAMARSGRLKHFIPFDVSESTLRSAAQDISHDYQVRVSAIVGDFQRHLAFIPRSGQRMVAFLGGTIGNLAPAQRHRFLLELASTMGRGDSLLLGTDLKKDPDRLLAAYDDSLGVTAQFNRNVLSVLNTELGATFDLANFDHVAQWNEAESWIEMRLRARAEQTVDVTQLALRVSFLKGEDLLTEISAKFTHEQVERELGSAHLVLERSWLDADGDFLVSLARSMPG